MAKFDGVKGYLLLEVEKSPKEVTLVFRDNRFLFISTDDGEIVLEGDDVEGSEVEGVAETDDKVEVVFKDGKKLVARSTAGKLQTESIPE
ncbi:MAG: hypothetical protein QW514_00200 [Thermoprotei archaeon]